VEIEFNSLAAVVCLIPSESTCNGGVSRQRTVKMILFSTVGSLFSGFHVESEKLG